MSVITRGGRGGGTRDLFGLHTNSGIFSSSSLCPARLRGSLLVTINPPLALLSTYRIPEALFTTSLHSEPVVCFYFFHARVGTKTRHYPTVKIRPTCEIISGSLVSKIRRTSHLLCGRHAGSSSPASASLSCKGLAATTRLQAGEEQARENRPQLASGC